MLHLAQAPGLSSKGLLSQYAFLLATGMAAYCSKFSNSLPPLRLPPQPGLHLVMSQDAISVTLMR